MELARSMWELVERYHQLCYWAPEVRETGAAAGLKGFWMNYFATRAAPMGAVAPEVVESVFFYYSSSRVRRAIPDAWSFATPERILEARYDGMASALERELGAAGVETAPLAEAAGLCQRALDACVSMGKPLFAGWSALPWPDEPALALWHATTLLREHRSGCHLIALAAHELDGCGAVVSHVAVDEAPSAWIRDEAGWSDDEVATTVDVLGSRGWLDEQGGATRACHEARADIEAMTDRLDDSHWAELGYDGCARVRELLTPVVSVLPRDDQLDWREIYGPNES